MSHVFYFLLISSWLIQSFGQLPRIRVDPKTQHFIDEYGRVRIFHGVNVVYKIPPYVPDLVNFDPQNSLTATDLNNLHQWGFNVVRFYTAWMGVNPTSASDVDQKYLSQVSTAVQMMEDKGIYALLDCHQDVFSRYFCGEGVPDWVAQKLGDQVLSSFPSPIAPNMTRDPTTKYPVLDECLKRDFGVYYLSQAVMNGFKMLYTNQNGVLDSFASFWRTVASTFANRSSVLGYELLNEPPFANILEAVEVGYVDKTYLAPMYKKLHQVIRQVDDQHLIFYEPCVADLFRTGLTEGPGGADYNDRQVFSYHVYCIDVTKQGDPKSDLACNLDDTLIMTLRYEEAQKKKFGGMMLTEFGASINTTEGINELNRLTGLADDFLQSWSYWQFKKFQDITTATSPATAESFYDDKGELELNKVKALSRSYAQAIAGVPKSMFFDPNTYRFQLTFNINTNIQQPTVVFVNEDLTYVAGVNVQVSPASSMTWKSPSRNYYEFLPATSTKNGTVITITITPKSARWPSRFWNWLKKRFSF